MPGAYGGTYYAHGESGKGVNNYAFYNQGGNGTQGKVKAAQCVAYSSGATSNYGSYTKEYGDTYIDSCTVRGDSGKAVYVQDNGMTYVGVSKVEGGASKAGSGALKCVYTYDGNYDAYACP